MRRSTRTRSKRASTLSALGPGVPVASLVLALLSAGPAGVGAAEPDWPELSPGLWHFTRTLFTGSEPVTIVRQACVDPVREWKRQQEASSRSGCEVTTHKVAEGRFLTTAQCDIPDVGEGSSRSTATVTGPERYEVVVVNAGVLAKSGEREHLVAKRLGDCEN